MKLLEYFILGGLKKSADSSLAKSRGQKPRRSGRQRPCAVVFGSVLFLSLAQVMTGPAHAQSAQAVVDKLVQKGVLTAEEAKQLKAETAKESSADFDKAMSSKFGTPDWVTTYKVYGDLRGRFDDIWSDNPRFVERERLRYRLRAGLTVNMKDDLQAGFRLISGDAPAGTGFGSTPLSGNTTFQDDASKKFIYIDTAYGKWTPFHSADWTLSATVGKMDQPFQLSAMVFDPDLTPEGIALQGNYQLNEHQSLAFNAGVFALDEAAGSKHDPFLAGAQALWNSKWTPKLESSLGIALFEITSTENLLSSASTNATVVYINQGNTRTGPAGMFLASQFRPLVASGSATYKLERFPGYHGAFPIKIAGEFMHNTATSQNNEGYWAGLTLGKSGKKGTLDISYRYQYLEADAWYDQLVDDDNVGYVQAAAFPGQKAGACGGTNIKGHLVKACYSLTDALTLSVTCYINELIKPSPASSESGAAHLMADLIWKF